jgi:hypothetical protein
MSVTTVVDKRERETYNDFSKILLVSPEREKEKERGESERERGCNARQSISMPERSLPYRERVCMCLGGGRPGRWDWESTRLRFTERRP